MKPSASLHLPRPGAVWFANTPSFENIGGTAGVSALGCRRVFQIQIGPNRNCRLGVVK